MTKELHLFIIWHRAQFAREKILSDIRERFRIIEIFNIKWDEDNFATNLTRFYGEKLPRGSHKQQECGIGRFTLITVLDEHPVYGDRPTSRGPECVNVNMFDAKARYRQWTGGGHKIHATNNPIETRKDLLLLLGHTYADYYTFATHIAIQDSVKEQAIDRNLLGCVQWSSLAELFTVLNESIQYVVLRNFEGFPDTYTIDGHGDIDFLVNNRQEAVFLMNAMPVFEDHYRSHYKININGQTIRVDIRFVGDDYYSAEWQKSILKNRILCQRFYRPDDENYKYSLLYHALVHKSEVAPDYYERLSGLGLNIENAQYALNEYMSRNGYQTTEPKDYSVYFNPLVAVQRWSFKRKLYWFRMKSKAASKRVGTYIASQTWLPTKVRHEIQRLSQH